MVYFIDDSKQLTTLKITKDKQVVIEKSFKSLAVCFRWIYHNSRQTTTQKMVEELVSMKQWVQGSQFKFKKKIET